MTSLVALNLPQGVSGLALFSGRQGHSTDGPDPKDVKLGPLGRWGRPSTNFTAPSEWCTVRQSRTRAGGASFRDGRALTPGIVARSDGQGGVLRNEARITRGGPQKRSRVRVLRDRRDSAGLSLRHSGDPPDLVLHPSANAARLNRATFARPRSTRLARRAPSRTPGRRSPASISPASGRSEIPGRVAPRLGQGAVAEGHDRAAARLRLDDREAEAFVIRTGRAGPGRRRAGRGASARRRGPRRRPPSPGRAGRRRRRARRRPAGVPGSRTRCRAKASRTAGTFRRRDRLPTKRKKGAVAEPDRPPRGPDLGGVGRERAETGLGAGVDDADAGRPADAVDPRHVAGRRPRGDDDPGRAAGRRAGIASRTASRTCHGKLSGTDQGRVS